MTDRGDLLRFDFLSPPAPPVLCPRTFNRVAPFLPKVFIPLTSHLHFTAPLYTLAHPLSILPVLTNPDITPSTLPGFRIISQWVEEHEVPQQRSPVAIGQACWARGSAGGADSAISFTASCAAPLDHIICAKLVLQAVLVSHLLHGHMLNTIIVTLSGCQCWVKEDLLFLLHDGFDKWAVREARVLLMSCLL